MDRNPAVGRVVVAVGVALGLAIAACSQPISKTTAATKPMSPADGTKDYENGTSPHGPPVVPSASDTGEKGAPGKVSCPPQCTPQGAWVGCGLPKPRNTNCTGCTPKCKSKSTPDEGWYDCSGVLIVARACD